MERHVSHNVVGLRVRGQNFPDYSRGKSSVRGSGGFVLGRTDRSARPRLNPRNHGNETRH